MHGSIRLIGGLGFFVVSILINGHILSANKHLDYLHELQNRYVRCACDFVQNLLSAYFSMNTTIFIIFLSLGAVYVMVCFLFLYEN